MRKSTLLLALLLVSVVSSLAQESDDIRQGSLFATTKKGESIVACPLKSTSVSADISGSITRVRVSQEFENNFTEPIEAIYTFPLSQSGAVDDMTMKIGSRTIRGVVLKKAEARKVYQTAKEEGKTASLLDQDRPNVFTQAVANIMPGERIIIEIRYVEALKFDEGSYEFVFPMTVAPRYQASGDKDDDTDTTALPIEETRAGHDISIEVNLNSGVPVEDIRSTSHKINAVNLSANAATVTLQGEKTIPNKDFVLRYDVIGKRLEDALMVTKGDKGGFFSLILSPPERMSAEDVTPKEIVFVLDTSGSMDGFPIEKAKESMKMAIDGLYPNDTFNLITFAGDTAILFDKPMPATRANIDAAQAFLAERNGDGGTEMMKAVKAALASSEASDHMRIVCFMTDGMVDNEMEIIAEVKKHPKARVFSFGIGDSVNRFLLDKIASEGRGEAEYVMLDDDGSRAAKRFYERIRKPYLTDISINWAGIAVTGVYPKRIPDLFGAKPILIHGRYANATSGKIKLTGKIGGQPYEREITLDLPAAESKNEVLATLWARTKVDELMSQSWNIEAEEARPTAAIREQIAKLGIDYHLMTQYTSFVAVEERIVNRAQNGKRVRVPIYAPAGTAFESEENGAGGGMGDGNGSGSLGYAAVAKPALPAQYAISVTNEDLNSPMVAATPTSLPKTISGGVLNGKATSLPKPSYPAAAKTVSASGSVVIQVTIDESGNVVSASPVSGHPLLRAAAQQAANASKFSPTLMSGVPTKVTGVIVYNFDNSTESPASTPVAPLAQVNISSGETPQPMTPDLPAKTEAETIRRQRLATVMHVWVFDLASRLENGNAVLAANDPRFVRDGKAYIQIDLTAATPAVIETLRAVGFEINTQKATHFTGSIPIEKLSALAGIPEIKLILPAV